MYKAENGGRSTQSGDANVALNIPVSSSIPLENDKTVTVQFTKVPGFENMLYLNCAEGVFADPVVREAVSLLIDGEAINDLVNMGRGEVVQGYIPKMHKYYSEILPDWVHQYDPERGKELLAQAGYGDGFSVVLPCLPSQEAMGVVIKEQLRQANIDVSIEVADASVHVQKLRNGKYDMEFAGSAFPVSKADIFKTFNPDFVGKCNGGTRITDPAVTELIKKARSADEETAKQGFHDIMQYEFDNNTFVGLCTVVDSHILSSGLDGVRPTCKPAQYDLAYVRPAK